MEDPPRVKSWTVRLCVALMLGGVIVGIAYQQRNLYEADSPRPPYITKIERDLTAVDETGKPFHLSEMKGKVYLVALCSAQPGVTPPSLIPLIREVSKDQAGRQDFGVVLFSATPGADTPDAMRALLQGQGISGDNWRFVTAPPETLERFVKRYLRLYPEMPATAAVPGAARHDTRVVLVDRKANIRGYYRLLDPAQGADYATTLRTHLLHVLENP